ncbi:MAG: glycosyltransferase [Actinomycetota bacterium]|nr:glycosyltransferase [Actinomycetota bacterium]
MNGHESVRVVLCAPGFPASIDDFDKPFLFDHASALLGAGLQVTVVCPASPGLPVRQMIGGVEIHRVRYAPRRMETLATTGAMYREARGLKAILAVPMILSMLVTTIRKLRQESTVAYGHWWIPGGLVAVLAARFTSRPSIVHLHGSDASIAEHPIMRKLARLVLRLADERLAASEVLAKWGRDISTRDVRVLPMPLVFDRLPKPSPVPDEGFVLGVGRLVPEKGFDVLIDALACFDPDQRPELVVVGVGPDRRALAQRALNAGVSLHLPGAVAPVELADWYRRSRIVAVPSRREGFGLVAAEAAAAGRAVVGSSVGGIPVVVESGVSGLLVEPGDVHSLAKALAEVDPSWGANGPERVAHLDVKSHGSCVRQLCDNLTR